MSFKLRAIQDLIFNYASASDLIEIFTNFFNKRDFVTRHHYCKIMAKS